MPLSPAPASWGSPLAALDPEGGERPDPTECAATALRAKTLRGISDLWTRLEPEVPIYAVDTDGTLVAGRADAVVVIDGRATAVLDWKSDLDPTPAERDSYLSQLSQYIRTLAVPRGALVYLSTGDVVWAHATRRGEGR